MKVTTIKNHIHDFSQKIKSAKIVTVEKRETNTLKHPTVTINYWGYSFSQEPKIQIIISTIKRKK